jgi:hypothetical protein
MVSGEVYEAVECDVKPKIEFGKRPPPRMTATSKST